MEYFKFNVRQVDALICTAPDMLQFLLDLLVEEKSPLALRGLIADIKTALTDTHKPAHGLLHLYCSVGQNACSVTLCQE